MSLIMINLGSEDENYIGLIWMLDLLLRKYTKAEKIREAENLFKNDYNITLSSYNKEAGNMCNLSQGIYNEGSISKAMWCSEKLLAKYFSLDEALLVAGIDKKTYEEYSSK